MPTLPRAFFPHAAFKVAGILALALGCSGCSQVYTVRVDAMRTPEAEPRTTYHLVSAQAHIEPDDPAFREAAALVDRALEANGLIAAARPEWADMIVTLDFGVGPRRWVAVPDTGSAEARATAIFRPDRDGGTLGESTGTLVPTAALSRIVAMWEKRLSLVASENVASTLSLPRPGAQLWRVDVSLQDATPHIDPLLPVLVSALVDSIDRDNGPHVLKRISARAPVVALVSPQH